MKYPRIMDAFFSEPWAISEAKLLGIVEFMNSAAFDSGDSEGESYQAVSGSQTITRIGSIAILHIAGTIAPRVNMMSSFSGGTSIDIFRGEWREAQADPDVSGILLKTYSPGGSVYQVQEMAEEIYSARGRKPVIAQITESASSGAYWLISGADAIHITPSGTAGSIGVISMHVDMSSANEKMGIEPTYLTTAEYKAEGNPDEPLGDDAKAHRLAMMREYDRAFVTAVARGRGVSEARVRADFGRGRELTADMALQADMVDKIMTMDQTLAEMREPEPRARRRPRAMRARIDFPARVS